MEDLHITVRHSAHWEWVRASDIGDNEETRPIHPMAPEVVLVKRLIPGDNETEIIIPGEALQRMVTEYAEREGAPEPTRRHMHEILAIHVRDTLHRDHAPVHAWHTVESGDEVLQKALHARFITNREDIF